MTDIRGREHFIGRVGDGSIVEQWWFDDVRDAVPAPIERTLSTYLGSKEPCRLARGAHGKPYLEGRSDLHLSVSHGGGRTVLAVGRAGPIGIDCEPILPFDEMDEVAALSFSDGERNWWRRSPPGLRCSRFYELWTRKEAVVKAIGGGLLIPLNSFEVRGGAGDSAAWAEPPGVGRWWVSQIAAPAGFAAACAASQPFDLAIRREWTVD